MITDALCRMVFANFLAVLDLAILRQIKSKPFEILIKKDQKELMEQKYS